MRDGPEISQENPHRSQGGPARRRGTGACLGQTGLMPPATGFSDLGTLQEPGLQAVPRHKATCLVCCGFMTFLEGSSRN